MRLQVARVVCVFAVLGASSGLTGCTAPEAPPSRCTSGDATQCHGHIVMQLAVSGSLSLGGSVERDDSEGTLCRSGLMPGEIWSVPFPATPTPVDGHLVFGQGSILAVDNTGPGSYRVAAVDGLEVVIDDATPFVPGSGTVTIHGDGSGSMSLLGFSNGSAQIDVAVSWSCEDVAND